ncbi:MAG: hypothetical protein JO016_08755 [Actinobacteria bacterium]|nr:hypothetical protein [Actinomycetota bacterium]
MPTPASRPGSAATPGPGPGSSWPATGSSRRRRHHEAPVFSAVRTTQARGTGC